MLKHTSLWKNKENVDVINRVSNKNLFEMCCACGIKENAMQSRPLFFLPKWMFEFKDIRYLIPDGAFLSKALFRKLLIR